MYRTTKNQSRRHLSLALAATLACVAGSVAIAQTSAPSGSGNGNGSSDKTQSGATDPKILKTQAIPGMPVGPYAAASTSGAVQLASATLHTSEASDLSIRFTSECYVYTQDGNTSTQDSGQTQATATVWIEVDGKPVSVSTDPNTAPDDGKVGLCSRTQTLSTTLSDQDAINLAALTHAAHGFNWTDVNVGEGDHTVNVMATLDASANGTAQGTAAAVIGKRTLQVSAVHSNNSNEKTPTAPTPPKS